MAHFTQTPTAAGLVAQTLPVQALGNGAYGTRVVIVDPAAVTDFDRPFVLGDKWFQTGPEGYGLFAGDMVSYEAPPAEELVRILDDEELDLNCSAGTRRRRFLAAVTRVV